MVFLVLGGLSEGARPFPLKILDTKISVNSTSGECIKCLPFQLRLNEEVSGNSNKFLKKTKL